MPALAPHAATNAGEKTYRKVRDCSSRGRPASTGETRLDEIGVIGKRNGPASGRQRNAVTATEGLCAANSAEYFTPSVCQTMLYI